VENAFCIFKKNMTDVSSLASWRSQTATPVRQQSWSLAQSSSCIAHSTTASDSAIGFEDGLEIAAGNADDWLYYNSQYGVLVCRYHGYAARNLATHLSNSNPSSSYMKVYTNQPSKGNNPMIPMFIGIDTHIGCDSIQSLNHSSNHSSNN
jgi:hypothetical protein